MEDSGNHVDSPKPETFVISGLSGVFPNSHDVYELSHNLYNKINMVLPSNRAGFQNPTLPPSAGEIPDEFLYSFDSGYFGMHSREVEITDPTIRIFLEKLVEAVLDAGLHPSDLENTNTGIFVGTCNVGTEGLMRQRLFNDCMLLTGSLRNMIGGRAAYFLKTKGPTFVCDTACSSSLCALDSAMNSLKTGECDAAIVAGVNIITSPYSTLQFFRMGVLSPEGVCKSFDKDGRGYARSETVSAIFIQKEKDALRTYAELVYSKVNCDGYKEMGITYPSGEDQYNLLKEVYEDVNISPLDISYLESHGTGTTVGDPEECKSVAKLFTQGRKTPLLIGSVKSNLGHAEPASGLCSVAKCILAFETGLIAPNIHFKEPKEDIVSIKDGRIKVVTEVTEFQDDNYLIGINSFGFGGVNVHVLMKRIARDKIQNSEDNLPRLVCVSGRTGEAVKVLLDSITKKDVDPEYIGLLHNIFRKYITNHQYKGYAIFSENKEVMRSIHMVGMVQQPLTIIFGELKNWYAVAQDLAGVPLFEEVLERIRYFTDCSNINIDDIVFSNKPAVRLENNLLGAAIVELCITIMLKELNIKPTNTCGYGYGQLICAYFDDAISVEEVIKCIIILNRHLQREEIAQNLNTNEQITLVEQPLTNGNHVVPSKNKSLELRIVLRKDFGEVLKYPRTWKPASLTKRYASVDYFIDACLKWVSECDINFIRPRGLILEIGGSDVKKNYTLQSSKWFSFRSFDTLLQALGNLYLEGYAASLAKMYPKIKLPVSRGTSMISPYIRWKHNKIWPCDVTDNKKLSKTSYIIDVREKVWSYVTGHTIDGRNLFPAAGYLYLTWQSLSIIKDFDSHSKNVCFENCRFMRATSLPPNGSVKLTITHMDNGYFEIVEGDGLIVSGTLKIIEEDRNTPKELASLPNEPMQLTKKDIYKELRLRGYNYSGEFRALEESSISGTRARIFWNRSWIPFIDNMFQVQILGNDTRQLYVPTYLNRLTICPKQHYKYAEKYSFNSFKDAILPLYYYPNSNTIRTGGVIVEGLMASSIARKRPLGIPVLEKYHFVPNKTNLILDESIRVNMQIVLENSLPRKITAVELIDEATPMDPAILSPVVISVLGDQPLIQIETRIYTDKALETNILIENKSLNKDDEYGLVIGSKLLQIEEKLNAAIQALKENGFIISREDLGFNSDSISRDDVHILTVHQTHTESIVLISKTVKSTTRVYMTVPSDDRQFQWLPKVQEAVENHKEVVLISQDEPLSGLLGFVNCLRREPDTGNVKCVITDNAKSFDPKCQFYEEQLKKNLAINIYKNGVWGTYRHLLLEETTDMENDHCYVNQTSKGDLSSLRWMEGPIDVEENSQADNTLIKVYYAALNFRDIMTASGKINADVITPDRLDQECVQGFEFSGLTKSGERVMGMVSHGALSTLVMADKNLLMKVPDDWSLEEAASVPVVYGTIIYALKLRGNMRKGDSVLIHSGLGGVGQAAIRYALYHGLEVFATVGSETRKAELMKIFPELKESHIGNSHGVTFEQMIMRETGGRGVDLVLNSLAEEKLIASVRCLARGGSFLEIGKFDISTNNLVNLLLMEKECSFHGVMLDKLFGTDPLSKRNLCQLILDGIKNGSVKPLNRTVFKFNEVEKAFRFMGAGKHMGKVLIEVRDTDVNKRNDGIKFTAMPRYYCKPNMSYIIIGGLGGLGLEITDWLIIRGARKIILTSRNGVKNGYQMSRLRTWRRYGVTIEISQSDVTTKEGCVQLLEEAQKLGHIEAIFNLAAVLQDAVLQNQTPEMFSISLGPKAYATKHLDELSRSMCPNLRDFVVFSSVSCGRGNAGQTNYGMANSIMERICEERRKDGLPGLAIEWGAVGDVGLVADMQDSDTELEISGTLQQRISSCIQVLDIFLRQKSAAIVSSMVVAEKKSTVLAASTPLDLVAGILGVSDMKAISPLATLAEQGMDSMTAVEIKQSLERDFDIILDAKEIRNLTFARLIELSNTDENSTNTGDSSTKFADQQMNIILDELLPDESELKNVVSELVASNDVDESKEPVFFFPGLEGHPQLFHELASRLKVPVVSINYDYNNPKKTIMEEAESYVPLVEKYVKKDKQILIVSHSFGTVVAIETLRILESKGYVGTLISVDGAAMPFKEILKLYFNMSEEALDIELCLAPFKSRLSSTQLATNMDLIRNCPTVEDRIPIIKELLKASNKLYSMNYLFTLHNAMFSRLKALMYYEATKGPMKSKVVLCLPKDRISTTMPDDYELSEQVAQKIETKFFDGNHNSILQDEQLIKYIMSCISE